MTTALLVIDVQVGFVDGRARAYELDRLLRVITTLQERARESTTPIIFLQHDGPAGHSTEVGTPGWEIHPAVQPQPGDLVIRKDSCDGFHRTNLDDELRRLGVDEVVTTGYVTELCVDTTCRRGITLGYDMTLVADGHSTPDGGPPVHPAPDVRIRWTNHVLSTLDYGDRAIRVVPSADVRFA